MQLGTARDQRRTLINHCVPNGPRRVQPLSAGVSSSPCKSDSNASTADCSNTTLVPESVIAFMSFIRFSLRYSIS